MQRFLTYCVEAALRGEAPKEYTVGTEVFDRGAGYDPRVDPIVRVEARRLREKLEAYYAEPGAGDEVVIRLPKGSYVPVLERRSNPLAAAARAQAASIAVLPFTNSSGDAGDDYFSDGLTEELIHRLTRVEGLRVLAWPSASKLRGRDDDDAIRRQLDIDYVIRGSVRRGSGGIRITAQLVDAGTGEFKWSEAYSRPLRDLLDLQEEIAASIVSTLRLTLAGPARSGPANVDAHNLCLKGRYLAGRRTVESIRKSIACYEEAVALDPASPVAFAGLADGLSLLAEYADVPPAPTMERSRENALRALDLDLLLAEAHVSLAMIRVQYEWDWDTAERLFRRAIELNPGYARARHWYGLDHLAMLGRWDEASRELAEAYRLDPLSPIILEGRAHLAMLRRDYGAALEQLRAVLELEPSFQKAHGGLGRIHSLQGRYQEALEAFQKARGDGEASPSLLGAQCQVYGLLGRRDEAQAHLAKLRDLSTEKHVPLAIAHLGLGEYDRALDWLEFAAERREPSIVALGVHPVYDPLRGHPRFQALLGRAGFLR